MLARPFLSAETLGLSEDQRSALIKVLHMLERDEIPFLEHNYEQYVFRNKINQMQPITHFNMALVYAPQDCGVAGCIKGWAEQVGGVNFRIAEQPQSYGELSRLFMMFGSDAAGRIKDMQQIQPQEAARALSNYLITGKANWNECFD